MNIELTNGYWTVNGKRHNQMNLFERRMLSAFIKYQDDE